MREDVTRGRSKGSNNTFHATILYLQICHVCCRIYHARIYLFMTNRTTLKGYSIFANRRKDRFSFVQHLKKKYQSVQWMPDWQNLLCCTKLNERKEHKNESKIQMACREIKYVWKKERKKFIGEHPVHHDLWIQNINILLLFFATFLLQCLSTLRQHAMSSMWSSRQQC